MAGINPLPSLIRASAWDAAAQAARDAGRKAWSRTDYNRAVATQNRLVRACYGRKGDKSNSPWPFIRFSVAEQLQREGHFTLDSDFKLISAFIDGVLAGKAAA